MACAALAACSTPGDGASPELYRTLKAGDAEALGRLGWKVYKGDGSPSNPVEGLAYINLALMSSHLSESTKMDFLIKQSLIQRELSEGDARRALYRTGEIIKEEQAQSR